MKKDPTLALITPKEIPVLRGGEEGRNLAHITYEIEKDSANQCLLEGES